MLSLMLVRIQIRLAENMSHNISGQAIALDPKYAKAYYR